MSIAIKLSLFSSGVFFLVGLLTGVWKYLGILKSPRAEAHIYIDTAHRASLLYAFAALLLAKFVEFSPYSSEVNIAAVAFPIFFFAFAIITYIIHGILKDTDNQLRKPHIMGPVKLPAWFTPLSVWALIIGEIGGFLVLFVGFCQSVIF